MTADRWTVMLSDLAGALVQSEPAEPGPTWRCLLVDSGGLLDALDAGQGTQAAPRPRRAILRVPGAGEGLSIAGNRLHRTDRTPR